MFASLLLAASIEFSVADASFAYECASNLVEKCTPRDAGTAKGRAAAKWIFDTCSDNGVEVRKDVFTASTPRGRRTFTNLYCEFEVDPKAGWVVVMSHFDTKPGTSCPGANDGASTTGLLIALAKAVSARRLPNGNLMLIWTDGEECFYGYSENDGFWGSKHAAEKLARAGRDVRAAICIDMLGDRNLKVSVPANSDAGLAQVASDAARLAGLGDGFITRMREDVKDDHVPFAARGWRAIDLIDFEYGSVPGRNNWWHTSADTIDKISIKSLYDSGRLLAEMLNIIL